MVNGTYELVRERNGPFAGKKINRPVAKYDYCHRVCATYVDEKLRVKFEDADGGKSDKAIFDSLRGATGGVGQRKVRYHSRFFVTLARKELLCPLNWGEQVSLKISLNE